MGSDAHGAFGHDVPLLIRLTNINHRVDYQTRVRLMASNAFGILETSSIGQLQAERTRAWATEKNITFENCRG